MSFFSLPPELLLLITSFTVPTPSLNRQSYIERQNTLQYLSLVHRNWTDIAQELLRKEVWVRGREDEAMEAKEKSFIRKVTGTDYLTLEGFLYVTLGYTSFKMRNRVKYVRMLMEDEASVAEEDSEDEGDVVCAHLCELARFPLLEELVLAQGLFLIGILDEWISLPNLSRLVLQGKLEIDDLGSTPTPVFIPRNTPNLVNLALDETNLEYRGFNHYFSRIFNQITTLAIRDFDGDGSASALKSLDKLRNLQHLSLDTIRSTKQVLLKLRGRNLQSLHLSSRMVKNKPKLTGLLDDIAAGKVRGLRIERVIIYGPKASSVERNQDGIEWREDQSRPPFEDFDGR